MRPARETSPRAGDEDARRGDAGAPAMTAGSAISPSPIDHWWAPRLATMIGASAAARAVECAIWHGSVRCA